MHSPGAVLKATNVVGYVLLIVVNVLSNTGVLGVTNAEISDEWAFSIWGVIFFLQGCGVVYQQLPYAYRGDTWTQEIVVCIGYGWQAGWFFECAWQLAFIQQTKPALWLCTVFLLGALYQFVATLFRLHALLELRKQRIPGVLFFFFLLPTSINAAWLSVASSLGILIIPVSYGVSNAALEPLAAVLAVLFAAAGLYLLVTKRDAAYGFTLTWALVAVYGKHSSPWIKFLSLACIVVLSLFSILALTRRRIELEDDFEEDFEHLDPLDPDSQEQLS